MATTHSIFSFERSPSLLPQLAEAARSELEQTSFKSLQQLVKFFEIPASDLSDTPKLSAFQGRIGALQRLTPLAHKYAERLAPISAALVDPNKETLKPLLEEFCAAHTAYINQFIAEYQQVCRYEPFTILNRYPKTINIYLTAFFDQLAAISPQEYASWKQSAANSSEALLPIFSRLAIYYLLENPQLPVPELFKEEEMAPLRIAYKELDHDEKQALLKSLRSEPAGKLAKDIALLASSMQLGAERRAFNGVMRLVYEEAAKSFILLDQIHPKKFPQSIEQQIRTLFLALLKQKELETLPLDFSGEEVQSAIEKYRALTEENKREFEKLFLEEADDSDTIAVYDLLQDWKGIYFKWSSTSLTPLHLLARVGYLSAR
jgi:hypothetical protein